MKNIPCLMELKRCGVTEVSYNGVLGFSSSEGNEFFLGADDTKIILRSIGKPFILMALLDTVLSKVAFESHELAIMMSSHNGELTHVNTVSNLLDKYSISLDLLQCGTHEKFSERSCVDPLSNNCSGKHALFLIASQEYGIDLSNYLDENNPIYNIVQSYLEEKIFKCPIQRGLDGCSLPTFSVPLRNVVNAYLTYACSLDSKLLMRIRDSHLKHPNLIGGYDCLDSYFIKDRCWLAKSGSDGVWAVGLPDQSCSIIVKMFNGGEMAAQSVLLKFMMNEKIIGELDTFTFPFIQLNVNTLTDKIAGEVKFWK